jgi:hypothetical protein
VTTEQKLWITSGVLALAAIGSLTAWILSILANSRSRIDSPIVASGGSMTFRTQDYWRCSSVSTGATGMNDLCWTTENIKYFREEDVQDDMGGDAKDQNAVGTIYFSLRQEAGANPKPTLAPPSQPYIVVCTSSSTSACNNNTNYVLVQVYGSTSGLVTSKAFETNDVVHAVQYFDKSCHVHGTVGGGMDTPPGYISACEHPGYVYWLDKKYYKCKDGGCRILLTAK